MSPYKAFYSVEFLALTLYSNRSLPIPSLKPLKNTTFNHRQVWRLAWPMIIANISTPLLGLVDTSVMGHLDNAQFLAAVAIATLIFSFLFWGFGFLRMGTSSLSSQAFGANNTLELTAILLRALFIAGSIALGILLMQKTIANLCFYLINSDKDLELLAQQYFFIRIWSAPAILCLYVILGWFLGCQNTKSPLAIIITSNLCNIGLDLLFVNYYGMHADGVALASVIAEYAGLALAISLLIKNMPHNHQTVSWSLLFQTDKIKAMLLINGHLFIRTLCLIFAFSFFTVQGERLGNTILAANALFYLTFKPLWLMRLMALPMRPRH